MKINEIFTKPPLILIVDDTLGNLQVLGSILKSEKYKISIATTGSKAITIANEIKPDLILLDVMMPEMDGFETCKNLKDNAATKEIPIIFLTAKVESKDIIKGFEAGAVDYIAKPFNSHELKARVKNHLELKISRDLLKQKNEILEKLSIKDTLTGLFNHNYLTGMLSRLVEENKRYSQAISIAMLDIDNFKKINDEYGHLFGDEVLVKISNLIENSLRKTDIAGRYGGDEFMILFNHTTLNGAAISVKNIIKEVENLIWDNKDLKVTLSAGVCQKSGEDISALIRKADDLMYLAKKKGKNLYE